MALHALYFLYLNLLWQRWLQKKVDSTEKAEYFWLSADILVSTVKNFMTADEINQIFFKKPKKVFLRHDFS